MRNDEEQLKQLKRIADNVSFFFWMFALGVIFLVLKAIYLVASVI